MLTGEYAQLYAELQQRMSRGGDLSPGAGDTAAQFSNRGFYDRERFTLHTSIVERFKAKYADRPRGGSAVLLTAGAPGAGKSTVQHRLGSWQNEDSELGRLLTAAHGLKMEDYVVLDPDEFKRALYEAGGMPRLSSEQMALSFDRELTPAEMSGLLHREATVLHTRVEDWAQREGYNLLLDATLANEEGHQAPRQPRPGRVRPARHPLRRGPSGDLPRAERLPLADRPHRLRPGRRPLRRPHGPPGDDPRPLRQEHHWPRPLHQPPERREARRTGPGHRPDHHRTRCVHPHRHWHGRPPRGRRLPPSTGASSPSASPPPESCAPPKHTTTYHPEPEPESGRTHHHSATRPALPRPPRPLTRHNTQAPPTDDGTARHRRTYP